MKKFLLLVLAFVLGLTCLGMTACGGNDDQIKLIKIDLSSEEYAFAVKKGDTALKNQVNQFFVDEKDAVDAIFAKYTAEGVDLDSFGMEGIQTNPTGSANELVVATNLDFAPFEYTVGNKIAGIDMEIAKLLAEYLDKTLVIVHMDFEAVVSSVAELDTYDIGIAGLTITPERQDVVDFTDAYFGATQSIVVKVDDTTFDDCTKAADVEAKLATLSGDAAKCGGQKGTTSQFYIQGSADFGFAGFENLTFSPYKSAALAVTDMLNGNISFVVVDKTTANALVSSFND